MHFLHRKEWKEYKVWRVLRVLTLSLLSTLPQVNSHQGHQKIISIFSTSSPSSKNKLSLKGNPNILAPQKETLWTARKTTWNRPINLIIVIGKTCYWSASKQILLGRWKSNSKSSQSMPTENYSKWLKAWQRDRNKRQKYSKNHPLRVHWNQLHPRIPSHLRANNNLSGINFSHSNDLHYPI